MRSIATVCAAGIFAGGVLAGAGQEGQRIPEPRKQFGASVTGSFEGWFTNADGSRTFLVGYLNRNLNEEIDVPIGLNNRIEPGGPDMGQPTHFMSGRRHGMFTISVPKEFTPQDKYTWTLVANGETTAIPLRLNPDYLVNPFKEIAVNNTPPLLRFDQGSAGFQGPVASLASAPARTASVTTPLPLTIFATDDLKYTSGTSAPISETRPPVILNWSKYRGPGAVQFTNREARLAGGKTTASATFERPGA